MKSDGSVKISNKFRRHDFNCSTKNSNLVGFWSKNHNNVDFWCKNYESFNN